ncbi:hypothetical protein WJX73_005347 [Symbiochloris irregularis]|uniref:Succinate-semialdehyde dehydrogenase, mitochondrial n=1 Tax=Symbiochloris irregularis TaxID=706552 RepID=A0AAW1NSN6_9CHLO
MQAIFGSLARRQLAQQVSTRYNGGALITLAHAHNDASSNPGAGRVSEDLLSRLKDKDLAQTLGYIGDEWTPASDGSTYPVMDPSTDEEIARVANLKGRDTNAAIAAAHAAFPSWSKRTAKDRGAILRKWYELVLAAQDDICTLMTFESGKPFKESQAEFVGGVASIEWFAEQGRRVEGDILQTVHGDRRQLVIKQPVGVCASITPWNFPFSMVTRKNAPALAAGCTIVHKPAEQTPLTALAMAKLAQRAGVPAGVYNVVSGDAAAIGNAMVQSDLVRKLGFTGSTRVGKMLMAGCADTVKRISMELGGNAPFIVFDDADVQSAAANVVASAFRNAGQTCICANRIFVQEPIAEEFEQAVVDNVRKLKLGGGMDPKTTLGPLIAPNAIERVKGHVDDALAQGGRVLIGGSSPPDLQAPYSKGYFFQPTVIADATPNMKIYREETFGPAMPVFRFKYDEEAVKLANDSEYGLAGYFFTTDLSRAWRVAEQLQYGMIGVNEVGITSEVAPFGGVKHSGLGREHGKYGMDEFLEIKYIQMGLGYSN